MRLQKYHPEIQFELVTMKTTGDIILNQTLDKIGGKGLFVKELDIALAEGRIDCCVHSLKDMPMEENPDFPITALPKRGDPRDVLVLPQMQHFENITAQIGSSSFRRQIQLKKLFPSCHCLPGTRQYHYQIAKTGLRRIFFFWYWQAQDYSVWDYLNASAAIFPDEMIPAAGQGILAVQSRKNEDVSFLSCIHNKESEYAALAERAFVRTLDGGCSSPIAAYAQIHGTELKLTGLYAKEHQWEYVIDSVTGNTEDAVQLGEQLSQTMKGRL